MRSRICQLVVGVVLAAAMAFVSVSAIGSAVAQEMPAGLAETD